MNRTTAFVLTLGLLAGAALAPRAEAGWRLKDKPANPKRIEMPEEFRRPHRFENQPTMQFQTGTLRREGMDDWWFGDYRLQLSAESVVIGPDGENSLLQEGRQVAVMGAVNGNTMSGWSVRLLGDEMPLTLTRTEVIIKPSDSDPDVGEIINAPH